MKKILIAVLVIGVCIAAGAMVCDMIVMDAEIVSYQK